MLAVIYPFLNFATLFITLLCWIILNPIVVLFVDNNGNLPRWLSYFQTFDAPLPKGYKAGLAWLNRNPAYGFDLFLFGIKWAPETWKLRRYTDTPTHTFFFATGANGAFNMYYHNKKYNKYLKFGWKAWNFFDRDKLDFSKTWEGSRGLVPVC